jgi:hypothetical protein
VIGLELTGVAASVSLVVSIVALRRPKQLAKPNYRGALLPVVLGLVVISAAALAILVVALERAARSGRTVITHRVALVGLAVAIVFTAGLVDDLTHGGPRGLRGHVAALRDGRVTSGMLKVVAALAGGVIVVLALPHRSAWEQVLGVVVMAGAANLWNGLDVAPGRAAKAFLVAGAGVLVAGPAWAGAVPLLAVYGAEIPSAWLDLREHAMLGDAGANALGAVVGAGLYTILPGWGLGLAAAGAVGLNVLAETITLSRAIDSVPPIRWLDRAGRPKNFGPRD